MTTTTPTKGKKNDCLKKKMKDIKMELLTTSIQAI